MPLFVFIKTQFATEEDINMFFEKIFKSKAFKDVKKIPFCLNTF